MGLGSEQHTTAETEALQELAAFPLVEALYGRRSRRFALGDEIPDGALVDPAAEEVMAELMVERHRERLRRLSDERLYLPAEEPYLEGQPDQG